MRWLEDRTSQMVSVSNLSFFVIPPCILRVRLVAIGLIVRLDTACLKEISKD